jgi:hypothetical protein
MSGSVDTKSVWVSKFLGIDVDREGGDQRKGPFGKLFQKKPEPPKVAPVLVMPEEAELAEKLRKLGEKLAALETLGFDTHVMEANRADSAARGRKAEAIVDDTAKAKAIASVKQTVTEQIEQADALAKSVSDTMGKKTGKPDKKQKKAIFTAALKAQYGITIDIPKGFKNSHLDRVFDMFGMVPKEHANQDMLKKLLYFKTKDWDGSGAYNKDELAIKMGNFGKAEKSEDYSIDGVTVPANSFDVTTLHEIGHAVDNKHKFMENHGTNTGCGNWQIETIDSVVAAYLPKAKSVAAPSVAVTDPILKRVIKAALESGDTEQPNDINNDDWQKIKVFLTDYCLPIRSSESPWFETAQVVVNERVYQQAYKAKWVSYKHASRAATRVNNYQWRAPGEWFAEIYAITWLAKKKPPTAIDPAAAAFMWQDVS